MFKLKKPATTAVVGTSIMVALFSLATVASAAMVNVDFNKSGGGSGTYSGIGAASDTGTFWNGLTVAESGATTSGALTASDGVTQTSFWITLGASGGTDDQSGEKQAGFATKLLSDYTYGGDRAITINGLVAGEKYQVYFYSQNAGYISCYTKFTVGMLEETADLGSNSAFVKNANYVVFPDITASAGGVITGVVLPNGTTAIFNGFQISGPVPEPASLALLGLGALALLRRRRN
jgi:hypothetical protein